MSAVHSQEVKVPYNVTFKVLYANVGLLRYIGTQLARYLQVTKVSEKPATSIFSLFSLFVLLSSL